MEARTGPERRRTAADMGDPFPLDDVADLVVGMAVHGRLTGLDAADELRHGAAAGVLVDEISKRTLARRLELRLVLQADGRLAVSDRLGTILRREHRDDEQLAGPGILDRVRLAGRDEDPHLGLEPVAGSVEMEPAVARDDVEHLLAPAGAPIR